MNRSNAVTLRLAAIGEAAEMSQMSRDLIETGLSWRYTTLRMAALIAERDSIALVAHDGVRIEGFAVVQFLDEHAHLALLCVRPHARRRGTGRSLHDWLLRSAQVAGMESLRLELRADNPEALAFYESLGYRETQLVPRYYDDEITARRMTLALRTPRQ